MKKSTLAAGVAGAFLLSAAGVAAAANGPGERFEMMDANGDGIITADELEARQNKLLAEADANGDGGLSHDELRAHRKAKREERRAKNNPDTNGDGVVDRVEFQEAADKRFDRMDKNGDGVLSEDERPRRYGRQHRRRFHDSPGE